MWVLVKKKNSLEISCCHVLLILVRNNDNRERSLGFAAAAAAATGVCQEEGILWL
jgi:hypothetical protein